MAEKMAFLYVFVSERGRNVLFVLLNLYMFQIFLYSFLWGNVFIFYVYI